jgi:hypothetical protein
MAIISNKDAALGTAAQTSGGAASWAAEKVTPFLRERTDRALALKRVASMEEVAEVAALPMLATAGDVREVVRLLKKRPGGVTIIEGMDAVRRIFDPRKVAAYEYWGLVTRANDRLRLSALGWEFARKLEPEAQLFRAMLNATLAYRSALEWVFGQNLEIVTDSDVAAYWLEHPAEVCLTGNQKTIEGNVVCFFHLCQEAELGMATLGKRGQPARLRVDREELADYINGKASALSNDLTNHNAALESANEKHASPITESTFQHSSTQATTTRQDDAGARACGKMRVFISRRRDAELAAQVQLTLEVAEMESEVCRRDEGGAGLLSDEIVSAMRRCDAAVIIVSGEDCRTDAAGNTLFDESLMMEIASAIVHYNRRVILLRDESVTPPDCVRDLCNYEFAGQALTWNNGLQLLKTLKTVAFDGMYIRKKTAQP